MSTRFSNGRTAGLLLLAIAGLSVAACTQPQTEAQQREELRCAGGVVAGAALGGVIGNQLGKGTGNAILTAGGAAAGGLAGANAACQ